MLGRKVHSIALCILGRKIGAKSFQSENKMPRRNIIVPSSSSDEDDGDHRNPNPIFQNHNPNINPNQPAPLEISDEDNDEFVDVADELSPPPSPPHQSGYVGPIDGICRSFGLFLRQSWIDSCLGWLHENVQGFSELNDEEKAKAVFGELLVSEMNFCGAGVLLEGVNLLHNQELEGPFVLQVDEMVNICLPIRQRYNSVNAGPKRCLKLCMTDGVQRVFGIEYKPITKLDVLAPPGFKVVIRNVQVRRGLLMLVPDVIEVLGGFVDELREAQDRLIKEVTKPPRGIRRHGRLPLAERATTAAWAPTISNGAQPDNLVSQDATGLPVQQVDLVSNMESGAAGRIMDEIDSLHISRSTRNPGFVRNEEVPISRSVEHVSVGSNQVDHIPNMDSSIADVMVDEIDDLHISRNTTEEPVVVTSETVPAATVIPARHASAANSPSSEPIIILSANTDEDNIHTSGAVDGNIEVPFTYMASLLAKWAAQQDQAPAIRAKIKCFLTGVIGFQFKQRSRFELLVYVDDGSLISEVLIDHHVVQKGIGHSPEEVTAALSSPDKEIVAQMRNIMKDFQLFLSKFEGTMLVEISGKSPPLAIEMSHEVSSSDAWMLLRRLKSSANSQTIQTRVTDAIELSPNPTHLYVHMKGLRLSTLLRNKIRLNLYAPKLK